MSSSHGPNKNRKISLEVAKTSRKRPPPYAFHYDPAIKGWRAPTKDAPISKWAKAKGAMKLITIKKKSTVLNIDVKSLVSATARQRIMAHQQRKIDFQNTESSEIELLKHPSVITKPFVRQDDRKQDAVWMNPPSIRNTKENCHKLFNFERPKTAVSDKPRASTSIYQIQFLRKRLEETEQELKLVTQQLVRVNAVNCQLLKELEGYRGKNYDDIYNENITLKQQVARITKENVLLQGYKRQEGNKRLQEKKSSSAK
ncbi:hypothetical protein CHS0354_043008 [Potamilus streckersoni]|uniref:Uncharacterized protein n=1 Tax=Potamilus streckersoni TaxID=2493646 RepID=A0AAE0T4L0_9BIVA|nr:hypothetical protein CHS0354_043008 [Potamilus streckersoni]